MDFNYSPEQEAYRMDVRKWLEANQPAPLTEQEKEKADEEFLWQRLKKWHKRLYEAGWMGLTWPKEYGGRGATFIEQIIFQQELGRLGLPFGWNILGVIMTGPALMQWGTEQQKHRYLQPILAGEEMWCEGMSEPGAGSDLAALQTRAVLEGDTFKVNGQKVWTTIAQFACEVAAKKYNGLRSLTKRLKGQMPGAEASISKLVSTELSQRMVKYATRLLGQYALLERRSRFAPDGDWVRRILASEAMTIGGGTSAVQRNMIGERILGLPKG